MSQPGFWNNPETAQEVIAQVKSVKALIDPLQQMLKLNEDMAALFELQVETGDPSLADEIQKEIRRLEQTVNQVELITLYKGPHDTGNCYFHLQCGTGGADACDWTEMMLRMYLRYCERVGYEVEEMDRNDGEDAGIQSAELHIKGPYAYGNLACEVGVHRMERVSPFNAQGKRQTSFAAVNVTPELADIEIQIDWDEEVREDTYRAGGKGGQHVNKTSSAVRLVHLATGIISQCQNQRSQHQNRAEARKVLMSRLYQLEEAKRDVELSKIFGEKGEIGFGYRIRSYTLHSYNLIKDERTGLKVADVDGVLDGNLQPFIEAELRRKAAKRGK